MRGLITLKTYSETKISIIGGDLRQLIIAKELNGCGFKTTVYGFEGYEGDFEYTEISHDISEAVEGADVIVLPLPFSSDGHNINCPFGGACVSFERLLKEMNKDQLLLGGRFENKDVELAKSYGIRYIDYFEREELNVLNAVPTAEGALAIAMNELPVTIHSSKAAVLGYGRIGKVLSRILSSLGAYVTVVARKPSDIAWINIRGFESRHFRELKEALYDVDVIFNTVPSVVVDREVLSSLKKDVLIIDLASKPGGVDLKSAKDLNVKVIWALSLPGKVAPVSAGKIIEKCLLNILSEEGVISHV